MVVRYKDKTDEAKKIALLKIASNKELLFTKELSLSDLEDLLIYSGYAYFCPSCEGIVDFYAGGCNYCGLENSKKVSISNNRNLDFVEIHNLVKIEYKDQFKKSIKDSSEFYLKAKKDKNNTFWVSFVSPKLYVKLDCLSQIVDNVKLTKNWKVIIYTNKENLFDLLRKLENEYVV